MNIPKHSMSSDMPLYGVWLLPVLVGLMLFPVWYWPYFPTVDGPVHAYNADLLLKLLSGDWPLHSYYLELNSKPDPNWLIHLMLAGLISVSNAVVGEKLLISLYIVFFAWALVYALTAFDRRNEFLAFLGFPLITGFIFHFGFMSFLFSLPMGLLVLGYWSRYHTRLTAGRACLLGVLVFLLYLFHVVIYIATMLALGLLTLWFAWLEYREYGRNPDGSNALARVIWQRLAPIALAVLPSLVLFLVFFLGREVITEPSNGPLVRLAHLLMMTQLVSFNRLEGGFSLVLGAALFGLLGYRFWHCWRNHDWQVTDALLVVLTAELLLYALTPDSLVTTPGGITGGGLIQLRLSYFPPMIVLIWLSTRGYCRWQHHAVILTGTLVTIGLLLLHMQSYQRIDRLQQDYLSAARYIDPGATYMPLRAGIIRETPEDGVISARFGIFTHVGNRVALERNAINLQNLEAMVGYFAVRFRPGLSPYDSQGRLDIALPDIKLRDYEALSGKPVTYVSLWAADFADDKDKLALIRAQLARDYSAIYSSPRGYLELYKRRQEPQAEQIRP